MREELAKIENYRGTFIGTVRRFGTKPKQGYASLKTILLVDVTDHAGAAMCDHVWFIQGIQFERLELRVGERVAFRARVLRYIKGYKGNRDDPELPSLTTDFRLAFPTDVRKLDTPAAPDLFNLPPLEHQV